MTELVFAKLHQKWCNDIRDQTLAQVEKIIDKVDKENGWEENPVTKHRAILVLTLQERIKKEIKTSDFVEF